MNDHENLPGKTRSSAFWPKGDIEKCYFRYQASEASFTVPQGMRSVLFPYVVAVYLAESPKRVGQAQMVLMLPGM